MQISEKLLSGILGRRFCHQRLQLHLSHSSHSSHRNRLCRSRRRKHQMRTIYPLQSFSECGKTDTFSATMISVLCS